MTYREIIIFWRVKYHFVHNHLGGIRNNEYFGLVRVSNLQFLMRYKKLLLLSF